MLPVLVGFVRALVCGPRFAYSGYPTKLTSLMKLLKRLPNPGRDGWGRGAAQTFPDIPEPQDHLQEGQLEYIQ